MIIHYGYSPLCAIKVEYIYSIFYAWNDFVIRWGYFWIPLKVLGNLDLSGKDLNSKVNSFFHNLFEPKNPYFFQEDPATQCSSLSIHYYAKLLAAAITKA